MLSSPQCCYPGSGGKGLIGEGAGGHYNTFNVLFLRDEGNWYIICDVKINILKIIY